MTPDFKGGARHLESLWWRQGSLGLTGLWLIPASLIYRAAWSLRALLFGLGLFKVHRAPVPVVVVGNVVVGGAGKTPCTIALVQALQSLGWTPGVITRGYAGSATLAQAVAQRALEGFVRAVAKELRQGATAQLLWVEEGAEANLGGALGFFLSPRSAYVSGQSLRLQPASLPPHAPTQPLAGRQILVTGAARGIGVAVAETLARDGARVIALDVPSAQEPLQALAKRIGGQALALDITDPEAPTTLVRAALAEGGWDGLVHNAGITRDRSLARMPAHQWALVQAINLQAPITITQADRKSVV